MNNKNNPNILWIGLDQFRWDSLGSHGNTLCRTEAMDGLVREGVDFTRAYTPCSLCSPARASMLTGLYAFRHGMGTNCDMYHSLAEEISHPESFLAERFREAGYRTAWTGKWHVGKEKGPADYGWEGFSLPGYGNILASKEFQNYLEEGGFSPQPIPEIWLNPRKQTLIAGQWGGPQKSTPSAFTAESAMEQMGNLRDEDSPFFVSCQFWGPHGPFMPSEEFYGLHKPQDIPPWPHWEQNLGELPRRLGRERDDFYRGRPRNWEQQSILVARYYDMCAMIDHEIGRMMDWLEKEGLRENTIVVLSADHGDMNGAHGGLFDKGFLYEDVLRVPLVFSWPGHLVPGTRDELASNMDILPTLMELCGMTVPSGLDGISLAPSLGKKTPRFRRQNFLAEFHGLRYLYSQRGMITHDGWKYIFTPGDDDEVYNLNKDPWEMNNLREDPGARETVLDLQNTLENAVQTADDPLRDCVSKFFGRWYTSSGQVDASKFFDKKL